MTATINTADLLSRTEQTCRDIFNRKLLPDIQSTLHKFASKGYNWAIVHEVVSFPALGRLSFDGNSDHLEGVDKLVWDYLQDAGLKPTFYKTTGQPLPFGQELVGGGTLCHVVAHWEESATPARFLALELKTLRDAAVASEAEKAIAAIPALIDEAVVAGRTWVPVLEFSGLDVPNELFPFDGKKESITGAQALVWSWLEHHDLHPRLYKTCGTTIWIHGIGQVNYKEGAVQNYHIAACWYNPTPRKQKEGRRRARSSSSNTTGS